MNEVVDGFTVIQSFGSIVLIRDHRAWAAVPASDWENEREDVLSRARSRYDSVRADR
jgi:hypothetical protein